MAQSKDAFAVHDQKRVDKKAKKVIKEDKATKKKALKKKASKK